MGTLKTTMLADMAVFFNTDHFAEDVVHYTSDEVETTITVVITRNGDNREPNFRNVTTTAKIEVQKTTLAVADVYRFYFDSVYWELDESGVTYEDDNNFHVDVIREQP